MHVLAEAERSTQNHETKSRTSEQKHCINKRHINTHTHTDRCPSLNFLPQLFGDGLSSHDNKSQHESAIRWICGCRCSDRQNRHGEENEWTWGNQWETSHLLIIWASVQKTIAANLITVDYLNKADPNTLWQQWHIMVMHDITYKPSYLMQ